MNEKAYCLKCNYGTGDKAINDMQRKCEHQYNERRSGKDKRIRDRELIIDAKQARDDKKIVLKVIPYNLGLRLNMRDPKNRRG